ncbi:VanZ family protein [Granulosicoccus sp.]|nr:VanZ family protein [Granulosicoccus sp.]MDB4223188.1 VanZ family protein [Granulosicoccus sp.]
MVVFLVRLIASAVSIAIMLLFSFSNDSLLWSAIQNAGHFLIFTALSFCFLALFKQDSLRRPIKHVAAVLALMSLGVLVELAQSTMPDRTASANDLMLDAAGILMGYIIFSLTRYFRLMSTKSYIGLIICGLVTIYFATQPALRLSGYHLLKKGSPSIVSFGDPFVETIIRVSGRTSVELVENRLSADADSKRLLRMNFADDNYGGVIFHDTAKHWTDASYLVFKLHNTSDKSREIALRIHDHHHNNDYHDRYNTTLLVNPGANVYRLPITDIKILGNKRQNRRPLDMENIDEIQLFSIDSSTFSLYLSGFQLIPI